RVFATLELGTAGGQPDAAVAFVVQLYYVLQNQGRLPELAGAVRSNVETMSHVPAWRAALALLYCETDQLAEARAELEILRAGGFEHPLNWSWTAYMQSLSEVASVLGDVSAAAALYERLCPLAGQVSVIVAIISCYGSYAL
ncbi:MAG TPA: hypothetical protein VNN21_11435, partial [Dehalococcoidia bacterium]|nr:hypothetical protein [Dehalococcoidia bacterium]